MIQASYSKYTLHFKKPGGTSRGVLHTKETYFIKIQQGDSFGIGECALFRGLSADDVPQYEAKLAWVCQHIQLGETKLIAQLVGFPSIVFGLEQAFLSLQSNDSFTLFPSKFTANKEAIPINGLIWMGTPDFMKQQIKEKIQQGFTTIKLKIGAIDFDTELALLQSIRNEYSTQDIILRVDANGAFTPENAMEKLHRLSELEIHSIEQPIKAGQWKAMAELCENTPLPIALDEELIGNTTNKQALLKQIKPQYIILKPSLIGGINASNQWIELAESNGIDWWITSALESNIGLNAIAQYTYQLDTNIPQGLGTGSLFTNNINSPLVVKNGYLHYSDKQQWDTLKIISL